MMRFYLFSLALLVSLGLGAQTKRPVSKPKTSASKNVQQARTKTPAARPIYKEIAYTIDGTTHGYNEGEWVRLCESTSKGLVATDSAEIKDSKFHFKGQGMNVPHKQYIVLGEGLNKNITELFLEEGNIKIELWAGKKTDRVWGTRHNDIYTPYRDSLNSIYTDIFACIKESYKTSNSSEDRESYQAGADMLRAKIVDLSYDFSKKNIQNWVGLYLFAENHKKFSLQQNQALLRILPQKFASLPITEEIRKHIETQKK